MSTENNAANLDASVLDLCNEFIARRYAEESEYVPLLWEALRGRRDTTSSVRLAQAGLGFASENGPPLVAPFVLLTLEATLRELSQRGHAPDLAQIGEAVRCAAEALGASVRLIAELADDLPPRLAAMFSADDGALTLSEPSTKTNAKPNQLYTERQVDGQVRKPGWAKRKVRTDNRKNIRYDIVVDEIAREILIRKNRESADEEEPEVTRIDDVDPRVAAMLWVVLRGFGKSIEFSELRSRLDLDPNGSQDNGIHKAKSGLLVLLGERISKSLFGRSLRLRYSIQGDGVNFCWMRLTEDSQKSELLYRAGIPGE